LYSESIGGLTVRASDLQSRDCTFVYFAVR